MWEYTVGREYCQHGAYTQPTWTYTIAMGVFNQYAVYSRP